MDTQLKRYARKLVEEQLGQSRLQLAQIADDISFIKTQQDKTFSEPDPFAAKPFLTRFKIMICGVHPVDADPVSLPWAYPPLTTSGLRGESLGIPMLPRGTFVYVSRDMQTGEYFIERIAPNMTPNLPLTAGSPYGAVSGIDPKSVGGDGSPASDQITGNSRLLGGEIFGYNGPSLAAYLQNTPRDEAKWQFPTLDGAKNTVGGMSSAIENSIKDVERLKKGLIGGNSLLRQNLETLDNAERSVEAISGALKKQVKLISGYINTIMKKAQKKVLRMINQMMNKITAAGPLSGKFASNQLINKAIKVASCSFNLAISEMPGMVGQGLMGIVNKAVNTSSCLIENFVSNFVGQITGQLSALIEGAMGSISNILGGATDVLGSIGDVLGSIMNILNCEVNPKAGDPVVKEWNFLDGGAPVKITLNTDNIFRKAKKVGEKFKEATKVPPNINNYKFKFDPSQIAEDTMKQCGSEGQNVLGPLQCGPPSVTFWGGKGSGAKGNPVVSTAATNFGQLMGVEIVNSGNYTESPYVHVSDECGGGRGAVLQSILGPIEADPPIQDFTGNVIFDDDENATNNLIDNFNFEPLEAGLEASDLIGMEIRAIGDEEVLPVGTVITGIKEDTLILSNDFEEGGDNIQFRIVGNTPPSSAGITTFNVSVKNNLTGVGGTILEQKFVIDDRVQREMCSDGYTLERGKTYHFDQSSPSNGLVLKVGTDELELVRGEESYDIDTFWYDDVRIHPFRFSTKPDGIHNCDVSTSIDDPDEWPLAKDGLPADAWVLTDPLGWSEFLKTYGRYPGKQPADPTQKPEEGTWEVEVKEPGTYTFEIQADNRGTITFDGIYIGATDPIRSKEEQSIVQTESISDAHTITVSGLKVPGDLKRVSDTFIEFDDDSGDGFDRNAYFQITGGDGKFSDDGLSITGTGPVKIKYWWNDNPNISGTSLSTIQIEDITWTHDDTFKKGEVEQTVNLVDVVTMTDVIVYEQGIDLASGPHRNSKFLEVEVFKSGIYNILATIENSGSHSTGVELKTDEENRNPAALGWVLRKGAGEDGTIIATSNNPFKTTTETVISNCGEEYTDGVTKVGEAGKPNAYVGIEVAEDAPSTLYYYCENHGGNGDGTGGMGGKICIIDKIEDEDMSCRNAVIRVNNIGEGGRVTAITLMNAGTGYEKGSTNLLTKGGEGTSLTFDIVNATDQGNITGVSVRNGGKNYEVGDLVTPLCNFGGRVIPKTGIGVTAVIVKETGWGYKPWPNGDLGGMNRTWADRCQTIVHRGNGDWDTPYSYGEVATLYIGDCITLPAKEVVCIDHDFTEDMIPGSTVVREEILPRDMTDIKWGGDIGSGTGVDLLDQGTRAFEDAIPDPNNPYYEKDITYVERIDGTDPDYPAGTAQWWFYWNSEYKGTFIQDTLSQIPQIAEEREGQSDLIYRVAGYREKVETPVTIDLEEWQHVASEIRRLDSEAWVLTDSQGWSSFLKNYGVFPLVNLGHGPGEYDEFSNIPQIGTWSVEITDEIQSEEKATYHFEVQADNQGSITVDGIFLGSTTVFRSHNDSTFLEIELTKGLHTIECSILNQDVGRRTFLQNPAALAWVLRKGSMPTRQLQVETSTVLRENRNQNHNIVYTGLKAAGDVRWATEKLLEFDDDSSGGFDVNAEFEILSGDAVFVKNDDGTSNTIKGTGDISIRYKWRDNPGISGQVLDYLEITGQPGQTTQWDQDDNAYSGQITKTITLVDLLTTEEVEIRTESYGTVYAEGEGEGEIIRSSLNPFKNELELIESATKTLFGINKFESKDTGGTDPEEPEFTCDRDYNYAKLLGFSDCDIRNFLETSGMAVDQCMQDKLDDEDWGVCGDMRVLVTAPDCPEKGGECPPGYYFDNGVCRPDPCPPGEHWDPQQRRCVPDDCPPGEHRVNGVCVPIIDDCPPGQHKENGICVPDPCPPGYMKDPAGSGKCIPIVPTTCPPSTTYRVIACLESIIVANPGFGYNCCDDTVVIEPSNGAEAIIEECDGGILKVKVTKCGAGFRELPEVYINTETGLNAFLIPVLKFHRENFDEFPEGTSVLQVVDCVGNTGPNARTSVT
jgi:hypothetical protein